MSLVTYPCQDCRLFKMESGTGATFCASETGSECGQYLEVIEWAGIIDQVISLAGHQHIVGEDRADGIRDMCSGFSAILTELGGGLDETAFLHACGVRS